MKPYVAVVGGINIDICGKAFGPLIPRDSNPGQVRRSVGGVGRNVAHNLALLGARVCLLTALAGDAWEETIRGACEAAGIDLSHARPVPKGTTSCYLAIEGPEGDMALALCDNALAAEITPDYLSTQLALLNGAAAVVLDANLTREAIGFLAGQVTAPLFADPVSVSKAEKLRPVLGRLHTLKPNRIEAELLSGIAITDRLSLELAASKLLRSGLQRVCISLGSKGVYCAWDTARCLMPCPETRLVNASGGGDAMMAGFVRAFLDGLSLEASARFALACSSLAVESAETVNPELCYDTVVQKIMNSSVFFKSPI
ncbi:MAG: MarR family transcriptional regulator [Oscillospiraceae bacterium]|nr:MarR family transcriptional regulator [Oscillospiraceae bacterium]